VDRLIEEAALSRSGDERRTLYSQAQQMIAAAVPYIPLWYRVNVAVSERPVKRGLTPIAQLLCLRRLRGRICTGAAAVLVAVSASSPALDASERYDPRLRFRTISTPRFDIHFHQGEEAMAKRLAALAEEVATDMESRMGRPRMRVNVILVDQTDLSNGWATPVPYNLIEIVAATPRADTILGNTSDWLRLVFTHEYTHVLHLERSSGWLGAIGRPFGRLPFFYPNLFLPPMLIEGLATHEEGVSTREGRPPAGDFRMILDRAAAAGRFPALASASNALIDWPSGHAPYVYGGYFHEYLASTYGPRSLERLADETARQLPYLGALAFRKVYGKPLGDLWKDFARDSNRPTVTASAKPKQLTRHGFNVNAPWYSADGRLFYLMANPHGFPALMELTGDGPREVATHLNGGRLGGTREEIVFDQVDYVRSVAVQSDLYAVDRRTRRVRRLTRHARAADPHVSSDGTTIACTVQSPTGRVVATMRMPLPGVEGTPIPLVSEPDADFAAPRWSPDGRMIAAERRRLAGPSEIVLLDAVTGVIRRTITAPDEARTTSPAWSPDGRTLFFASARRGKPFAVHSVNLSGGDVRRLTNAGDSAQSPAISTDGRTLVFVGFTAHGFDLFSMALADAVWEAVSDGATQTAPPEPSVSAAASPSAVSRVYNPFRTLVPRFWSPVLETENDVLSVGGATGGFDALGRHAYFGGANWSTRARPDWYAGYTYDRWRPTFFADVSDDTDPWQSGTHRVTEFNTGAIVRFRRVRRAQLLFGSFHGATETFECASCPMPTESTLDRRAVRAAWSLDTSRRYGFSVSDEQGFVVTASAEWTREALGATGNATAAIVDGRGYARLGPQHAALAVRGAAASAWGDREVRRLFAAGGAGPQPGGVSFDLDAIALVRGFETDDVSGRRAAVVNVDYRMPLVWIERGMGTWPLFARSIHGAVFTDFGAAWQSRLTRNDRRASIGAELSADVVLAYSLPVTAAAGVAWRHDPSGRSKGATLFARIGRAF
jgi:hypothetical protein